MGGGENQLDEDPVMGEEVEVNVCGGRKMEMKYEVLKGRVV